MKAFICLAWHPPTSLPPMLTQVCSHDIGLSAATRCRIVIHASAAQPSQQPGYLRLLERPLSFCGCNVGEVFASCVHAISVNTTRALLCNTSDARAIARAAANGNRVRVGVNFGEKGHVIYGHSFCKRIFLGPTRCTFPITFALLRQFSLEKRILIHMGTI